MRRDFSKDRAAWLRTAAFLRLRLVVGIALFSTRGTKMTVKKYLHTPEKPFSEAETSRRTGGSHPEILFTDTRCAHSHVRGIILTCRGDRWSLVRGARSDGGCF